MGKKHLFKGLLLIMIVWFCNLLYMMFFYQSDLERMSPQYHHVLDEFNANTGILYLESPATSRVYWPAKDELGLGGLLSQAILNMETSYIALENALPSHYERLLSLSSEDSIPGCIILAIDLANFAPEIPRKLGSRKLDFSIDFMGPGPALWKRLRYALSGHLGISWLLNNESLSSSHEKRSFLTQDSLPFKNTAEWDRFMALQGVRNEKGDYDHALTEKACHLVKMYGFSLDTTNNLRLREIVKLWERTNKQGGELFLHLLPTPLEEAGKLAGADLAGLMGMNLTRLKAFFDARQMRLTDHSSFMSEKDFLSETGQEICYSFDTRKEMAWNLARELMNNFTELILKDSTSYFHPVQFSTDGESLNYFSMGMPHSEGHVRSGNHSSRIDKLNPYSMAFVHEFSLIPDSCRKKVFVEFYLKRENELPTELELVLEINPKQNPHERIWESISITEWSLSGLYDDWQQCNYEFTIPDVYFDSEIRIYVMNRESDPAWIDDFAIEFLPTLP